MLPSVVYCVYRTLGGLRTEGDKVIHPSLSKSSQSQKESKVTEMRRVQQRDKDTVGRASQDELKVRALGPPRGKGQLRGQEKSHRGEGTGFPQCD